jgi:hypothetical protein
MAVWCGWPLTSVGIKLWYIFTSAEEDVRGWLPGVPELWPLLL